MSTPISAEILLKEAINFIYSLNIEDEDWPNSETRTAILNKHVRFLEQTAVEQAPAITWEEAKQKVAIVHGLGNWNSMVDYYIHYSHDTKAVLDAFEEAHAIYRKGEA